MAATVLQASWVTLSWIVRRKVAAVVAAGQAVWRLTAPLPAKRPSLLREKPAEDIESLDVSIAASKGDKVANEIFQFTGKMLGEACADFAAFSSPEAFIFFGGLCKAGDLIMKPIEEAYNNKVLKIFKGKAKFLVSGLMNANAAVLGASALGWEE